MKSIPTILLVAAVVAAGLVISDAGPAGTAWADTKAQKETEKSPAAQGVSPADPKTEMPTVKDDWYCWRCGATNPYPKKHYKDRLHRPMMAPGARGAGRGREMRHRPRRGANLAADRVLRHGDELELTDDQAKRLETLAFDTKSKLIDLHAKLDKEQLELRRMIETGTDDMKKIRRQLDVVSEKRVDIQSEKLGSWMETKKILSDDQKKMIEQRFRDLAAPID
jgi:hypothetical protein